MATCKDNLQVREKLVEQLSWWATECDRTNYGCQASKLLVAAAKYIANGVTVQECGEWQREEQSPSGVFWFECSECHTKWGYGAVLHMKYCPNCGAKMKPLLPLKGE